MEVKKSNEANIDNSRASVVIVGILFVSSLILASFSYKAEVNMGDESVAVTRNVDALIQEEDQETPPPPPQQETPPQMDVTPPPTEAPIIEKKNEAKEPPKTLDIPPPPVTKGPTETKAPVKEIIDFPDVEAQFPGGAAALQQWIAKNVNYPQTSIEMNEQGRVYLSFVVEEDGSISNVAIVKGVSEDLDKEAKRLVRSMPAWSPGEAKGEKARTRCQIPINFTLK